MSSRFSRRVRRLRQRLSITQQRLADALGITRVSVARWETGATEPKSQWIIDRIRDLENE